VFERREPVDTMLDVTGEDLDYAASGRMFVTNGTSLCASPSRESAYLALERAKQAGCRVVFDVDYRSMSWRKPEEAGLAARLALPFVDVLIGNQLELKLVAGVDDLDQATAKLRDRGVPMLVSKLGELGTRVITRGNSVFLAPYAVDVVSTIGAGDGFASGFLCHAAGASREGMPPLWKCGGRHRGQPLELLRSHAGALRSGRDDAATKKGISVLQ
jgi:5-dehydro-2-deoxygluconokinase